jgi:cytochrome c oxidase subunit 1
MYSSLKRKSNRKGQFSLLSSKITSLQYPKTLGQIHFWITFFGVNLSFFPMHFLGLAGIPCHILDYPNAYTGWNAFSSFDSYVYVIRIFCLFVVVFLTLTSENKCVPSPWVVEKNQQHFNGWSKALQVFIHF